MNAAEGRPWRATETSLDLSRLMLNLKSICMNWVALCGTLFTLVWPVRAADRFLTIGGGYSPSSNQASLERNVLFYQQMLREKHLGRLAHDIYFSDGTDPARDLQVIDPAAVPHANRLMAEFFGSQRDLGLSYQNHQVADVRGETSPKNIRDWFERVGPTMQRGDRLVVYVTAHGSGSESKSHPYHSTISLWNNTKIRVDEMVRLLDLLPEGVSVVAVMVQCHAGGFARFIYNEADPSKGLSTQQRSGFFATVHDRPAAGCTPEIDEAKYVEYSTYFWEAIAGHTRLNQEIELPDYDLDGRVSFAEAHAYTILSSDTIDLPLKTSDEFLKNASKFQDDRNSNLLPRDLDFQRVLELATPVDRAVLEGLSKQLELGGSERLQSAERSMSSNRSRGRSRFRDRPDDAASRLRREIAGDLLRRWPELANLLNPGVIELLTTRSADFIHAVEVHPDYRRYRGLVENAPEVLDEQKKRVKFERFVRAAETVLLRENLMRLGNAEAIAAFQSIVEGESATLPAIE